VHRRANPILRMTEPELQKLKTALCFKERDLTESGFEICLIPSQCSRMMILAAFGSSSQTVHPDDHACKHASLLLVEVSQPWIVITIPANLHYPLKPCRNFSKFNSRVKTSLIRTVASVYQQQLKRPGLTASLKLKKAPYCHLPSSPFCIV
jgi:hypothetical protein